MKILLKWVKKSFIAIKNYTGFNFARTLLLQLK